MEGAKHPATPMFIMQYWHSESVPPYVMRAIDTFRDQNTDFQHLLFHEATAERFIGEHFTSREVNAFRACAVPSLQSDYVRYCAVLVYGGIYADVDMRCIAPLRPLVAPVEEAQFFRRDKFYIVPTGFFFVRAPDHPLLRFALELATLNIELRRFESPWYVAGPGIISMLYGIHMSGSLQAHAQRLSELAPKLQDRLRELADIVHAHAGGRIAALLGRARFSPIETLYSSYAKEEPMAYKQEKIHWLNWQGSIYR